MKKNPCTGEDDFIEHQFFLFPSIASIIALTFSERFYLLTAIYYKVELGLFINKFLRKYN